MQALLLPDMVSAVIMLAWSFENAAFFLHPLR